MAQPAALAESEPTAPAEVQPSYVVKAEFLVHFLEYVERPAGHNPGPDEPWVIGVNAADEVHAALLRVTRGKIVRSRPVVVRLLSAAAPLERVHVLYLSPRTDVASWGSACERLPILLVTEEPKDQQSSPGTVVFVWANGRVRFDVSLEAAERAGLKVSSRMLQVAHKVTGMK